MTNDKNKDGKLDGRLLGVERAAADLRRGMPVIVSDKGCHLMVLPLEMANTENLDLFELLAGGRDSFFLLTNRRAETLKIAGEDWPAVRVKRPKWMTGADMAALADPTTDLATPLKGPFERVSVPSNQCDKAAVRLAKIAMLLPALLVVEVADAKAVDENLLDVSAEDILANEELRAYSLKATARARVPLEGFENTSLISFRPVTGGVEHIAIIVGDPVRSEPVLTRLHSECFTGDLLGSLKCDCGDQLKGSIKACGEAGGGIVLYLAQEGRGIGLISKLKAYALQDQGYDTVDANTRLGFDVDERVFLNAAEMLKELGVDSVKLMTNNPNKVAQLEECSVTVAERVPHVFEENPHNIHYLAVKKDRTGHLL